jgi:hypothetical protein
MATVRAVCGNRNEVDGDVNTRLPVALAHALAIMVAMVKLRRLPLPPPPSWACACSDGAPAALELPPLSNDPIQRMRIRKKLFLAWCSFADKNTYINAS